MGTQLRILILIGTSIALITMFSMIKREKLELKYSLAWIFALVAIFSMALIPKSIKRIAYLLNIATPMNALFFLGIVFILIILFSLTIAQSRNSRKIKDMAQKMALLEYMIKDYTKKDKREVPYE